MGLKIEDSHNIENESKQLKVRSEKRVLLILPDLSGGGAERTSLNLLEYLDPKQFEVDLALLEGRGEYFNIHRKSRHIITAQGWFSRQALRFSADSIPRGMIHIFVLRSLIAHHKPDIVMSSMADVSLPVALAWGLLPKMRKQVRWIAREGNHTEVVMRETIPSPLIRMLVKKAISWAYRRTDAVIATSEGVAAGLSSSFAVPREKQIVIGNPVDVAAVTNACCEEPSVNLPKHFIVAVGRLVYQKGFDILLHAFVQINQPGLHLVILGKGPEKLALLELAQSLGVGDKVLFPGFLNNPWSVIARAQCFCLASRWEGFGHVIVEAMACGVPVVVSDCPYGPAEIVRNQNEGVLVPMGNSEALATALTRLLNDEKRKNTLKKMALKRAQDFSADQIASYYANVFVI
ncbi:MAG: glycosyltransferase involved in cell wall biosynthesis [Paraglaciecola sp.]|jgi:glycosyltransferase involved in cell wall biosynthesis